MDLTKNKQTKTILQGTYLSARLVNVSFGPSIQWERQCYFYCLNLEKGGIHPKVSWQTQVPVSWSVKQNMVPRGCGRGAAGLSLPRRGKLLSRKQWCPEETVYSTDLEAGPPSLSGQLTMVVSVLLDICCLHQCQAKLWKDKDCFSLHW